METAQTAVTLTDMTVVREGRTVLGPLSVSLNVCRLGVVGRNGSGKSTLARVVAGLIEPASGTARVDGLNLAKDRRAALRTVGLLFQNPDHQIIFPTVLEELTFGLVQQGQPKRTAETMAHQTLASFGKAHWEKAATNALSQGQKHLVCLMAIMAMQPSVLILDEPFAGLDIPTKAQLKRYLARYQGNVIHVSHDPQDLADCDSLLWLEKGHIEGVGAADQILPRYLEAMRRIGASDDLSDLTH